MSRHHVRRGVRKARLGITRTGLKFGLASEGSYGPHPYIPFIPGGREIVLFIDDERGIEIRESIVVTRTNYDSQVCEPGDGLETALRRIPMSRSNGSTQSASGRDEPLKPIIGSAGGSLCTTPVQRTTRSSRHRARRRNLCCRIAGRQGSGLGAAGVAVTHLRGRGGAIRARYCTLRFTATGRRTRLVIGELTGAGEGIRTLDPNLGKVMLYP